MVGQGVARPINSSQVLNLTFTGTILNRLLEENDQANDDDIVDQDDSDCTGYSDSLSSMDETEPVKYSYNCVILLCYLTILTPE